MSLINYLTLKIETLPKLIIQRHVVCNTRFASETQVQNIPTENRTLNALTTEALDEAVFHVRDCGIVMHWKNELSRDCGHYFADGPTLNNLPLKNGRARALH